MTPELQALAVRELVDRKGLRYFVRRFWHTIEAVDFINTWHIDAICDVLEAVSQGDLKRVVINQPPGTCKSTLVSVLWPAYQWMLYPSTRFMCTAYGDAITKRDAERFLSVVKSALYRACEPGVVLAKAAPPAYNIENTVHGRRYSMQLGGQMTGFHGDIMIIDDPIKPADAAALSGAELQRTNDLITGTLSSRFTPGAEPRAVCIMQRLAAGDPADTLLDMGYEHVMLPMRYVANAEWDRGCSPIPRVDIRTKPGEMLCPLLQSPDAVRVREVGLATPSAVSAQMQQNPVPTSGSFFEADWFRTWESLPKRPRYVQTWDLGFKGRTPGRARESHSRVHGALWAFLKDDYYLVDETIGVMNYPQTKAVFCGCQGQNSRDRKKVARLARGAKVRDWPRCDAILVEDKANGPALLAELQDLVLGLRPVEPQGSKEDRAARVSHLAEQRRVHLPNTKWAPAFRAELVRFPRQQHNDRVDTTTQVLDWMSNKSRRLADALAGLVGNA